jgi:Flp pilus assembly pilin Flp
MKEIPMLNLLKRFIREENGQDFAEYALILGAVGVVAIAVIARYRNELQAAFEAGIQALRAARGG